MYELNVCVIYRIICIFGGRFFLPSVGQYAARSWAMVSPYAQLTIITTNYPPIRI